MDPTQIGLIAGTLTMLWYWVGNLVMKIPISHVWVWRNLFWRSGIHLFLVWVFSCRYFLSHDFIVAPRYRFYAAWAAAIWFIPFVTFLKSIDMGKVSIVVPIANSSLLFTVIFTWLLLWESLNLMWWLAIFLIVWWLMLLSLSFHDLRWSDIFSVSSWVPYALFSSLGRWFSFVLFSLLIPEIGRVVMTLIISLVNFCSSLLMMRRHTQTFLMPEWLSMKYIGITALWAVVWTASYNWWVSLASTNLVAAIWFSGPLVVVIWSYFLYHERLSLQQYIWVLIVVAGIVWFSLTM